MQPTEKELRLYFSNKYHHAAYDETVEAAYNIRVHADGIYPEDLIETRRPNESEEVRQYRKEIYKPITTPYFGKIISTLNKIRRSTEWSVSFDAKAVPTSIVENETLESFLTINFPNFKSITNWVFGYLLREYTIESNGYIALIPETFEHKLNEYLRPVPRLFRADQIVEANELCVVIKCDEKCLYGSGERKSFGDIYYIITDEEIQKWQQIKADRTFEKTHAHIHNLGTKPAFKIGGQAVKQIGDQFIYNSRLVDLLPRFDEALREYSDLQAGVVQHLYQEKWEIGQEECETCNGTGSVTHVGFGQSQEMCNTCNGSRFKPRGPFTTLIVSPPMSGEAAMPTPPMGYVEKNTEIITVQDTRIDKHIRNGLAAINMEHLMETPLAESGIAKAYDTDGANNFIHSVAEDIIAIMDKIAYLTNELRYSIVVSNYEKRQMMLPTIAVPERFDLFSAQLQAAEIANAKTNKVNPLILNAMERDYASKRFSIDPTVRDRLTLTLELDPLPNISEEDKVMRLQNKGITEEVYILSSNITWFIDKAIEEFGESFASITTKEQKEILLKYAQEQVSANSAERQILSSIETATAING